MTRCVFKSLQPVSSVTKTKHHELELRRCFASFGAFCYPSLKKKEMKHATRGILDITLQVQSPSIFLENREEEGRHLGMVRSPFFPRSKGALCYELVYEDFGGTNYHANNRWIVRGIVELPKETVKFTSVDRRDAL